MLFSAVLLLGYSFREQSNTDQNHNGELSSAKFHCPSAPSFSESINNSGKTEPGISEDIDQGWYQKVIQDIQKEEYNITYSEELGAYQSPNRANNIRFIYHKDGFIAKTRSNKIPKFDVNDKTLREEEKQYEMIDEWSVMLKVESSRQQGMDRE